MQAGQRVLVASVDQAHSLGDALGIRIAHEPGTSADVVRVAPGFDVVEIDSLTLLEERFRDVTRMVSGAGHDHGIDLAALDPAELTGLPGVQELLALHEIAQFADSGDWDLIILDCPASADMLRTVTGPGTLLGYLERIWPAHSRVLSATGTDMRRAVLAITVERIAAAVTVLRDLLADSRRTGARLITGPERVALAESTRVRSAAALVGLRLDEVVVNKVLAPVPPDPKTPQTQQLRAGQDYGETSHPAVRWYLHRRAEQLEVITELRRRMPDVSVTIAHHSGPEPFGSAALSELARGLTVRGNPVEAGADPMLGAATPVPEDAAGEPQVRRESGAGLDSVFTLRMHLPVVDPDTLRLGRVEDDVIVGADGVRRRLRLAPVLRRCTVDGAELDGEQLIVRFRPDPELWPR